MQTQKLRKPRALKPAPAETQPEEGRYFSRAVGKAIQILELLAQSSSPMRLNDLARVVELTKSSTLRLLQTLVTLHYIERDANGLYLSCHRAAVQPQAQLQARLLAAASEPMRRLNMRFGETVSLAMRVDNHIEVIHVVESVKLIRMTNIVGRILPPHASSMGKMITAWQSPEIRKRLLDSYGLTRYNENTLTDERTLEEQFVEIRTQGYSLDAEETTYDGVCFGVGLVVAPETIDAAISLSMPKSRLAEGMREQILAALGETAEEILSQLEPSSAAI